MTNGMFKAIIPKDHKIDLKNLNPIRDADLVKVANATFELIAEIPSCKWVLKGGKDILKEENVKQAFLRSLQFYAGEDTIFRPGDVDSALHGAAYSTVHQFLNFGLYEKSLVGNSSDLHPHLFDIAKKSLENALVGILMSTIRAVEPEFGKRLE